MLLIGVLSAFALGGAAWAWYDRHRIDPWTRQMDQLRRSLQSIGVDAAPHEPPRTLAERLRSRLDARAGPLTALLDALVAGDAPVTGELLSRDELRLV